MMHASDMIFTMETRHLKTLRELFPQFNNKIFLLPLFERNSTKMRGSFYLYNIQDPYGKSFDEFRVCFHRIEKCLNKLFDDIKSKTGKI
ncbi:MAG: hypothetical protein AB1480_17510 [Nitrospirota bacterium]